MKRAYLFDNLIVVHPRGLPARDYPTGLTETREAEAIAAAQALSGQPREETQWDRVYNRAAIRPLRIHSNTVIHLNPDDLSFVAAYPCI